MAEAMRSGRFDCACDSGLVTGHPFQNNSTLPKRAIPEFGCTPATQLESGSQQCRLANHTRVCAIAQSANWSRALII
jgi:hypothetical protein